MPAPGECLGRETQLLPAAIARSLQHDHRCVVAPLVGVAGAAPGRCRQHDATVADEGHLGGEYARRRGVRGRRR